MPALAFPAPRPSGRPAPSAAPLMMMFTAEVSLGVHLLTRHRAPRVAAGLTMVAAGILALGGALSPAVAFGLMAALAAVGGARLLAPGAALASARRVPGPAWVPVAGRWVAAQAVIGPIALALAAVEAVGRVGAAPLGRTILAVGLAVGCSVALAMALAPLLGAFAAGALGCAAACAGALEPMPLGGWLASPAAGQALASIRVLLPTSPRAVAVMLETGTAPPALLAGWTAALLLIALRLAAGRRP